MTHSPWHDLPLLRVAHQQMRFSPRMQRAYEELLRLFEEQGLNFRHRSQPVTEPSRPQQLAEWIYWYFPNHLMRFQAALSRIDQDRRWDDQYTSFLEAPDLTVLDIGSGVGTAQLALLDLLEGHCLTTPAPMGAGPRVTVNIVSMEPYEFINPYRHLAVHSLTRYGPSLMRLNLAADVNKRLTDATNQAIHLVNQQPSGLLGVFLSNTLDHLCARNDNPTGSTQNTQPPLREAAYRSIVRILLESRFQRAFLLVVETEPRRLRRELETLAYHVSASIEPPARITATVTLPIELHSPTGSYWAEEGTSPYAGLFHYTYVELTSSSPTSTANLTANSPRKG